MIGKLNHVAIAVPNLEAATATYRDILEASVSAPQDVPEHGVTVVFVNHPKPALRLRLAYRAQQEYPQLHNKHGESHR